MIHFGHPYFHSRRVEMRSEFGGKVKVDFRQTIFPMYCSYASAVIKAVDAYPAGPIESRTPDGHHVIRQSRGHYKILHLVGVYEDIYWDDEPEDFDAWLNNRSGIHIQNAV